MPQNDAEEQPPRRRRTSRDPTTTKRRTRTTMSTLPRTTLLLLSCALLSTASREVVGDVEHYSARQLREILDFPITYSRYMPPWLTANYDQEYSQEAAGSTWTDPAQSAMNMPGWTKYLAEYTEGRAGEFSPPALRYTSDDLYAVSAWINQACPSSICRSADRSITTTTADDAAKLAALATAASMASQPNTGQHLLQFGRDHFSWYYVLARAATQNGSGQLLKVKKELAAPQYNFLRNANGKYNRDPLKGQMDTLNQPIFAGLRAGTNAHMREHMDAQSDVINFGLGAVTALSPFPANTNRYRSYGIVRRRMQVEGTAEAGVEGGGMEGGIAGTGILAQATMTAGHNNDDVASAAAAAAAGAAEGDKGLAGLGPAHQVAQAKRNGRQAKKDKLKAERLIKKGLKKGVHKVEKVGKHAGRKFKKAGRKWKHGKKKLLTKQGIPLLAGAAAAAAAAAAAGGGGGAGGAGGAEGGRSFAGLAGGAGPLSGISGYEGVSMASSSSSEGGDKGLLLQPHQAKPHLTIADAIARLAEGKANKFAPVIPPGPINHAPPPRQIQKFKPVVPAFYHGQKFHPSAKPIPLVVGEHHFIHPKMAAHFNHAPMDYEHTLCDQGYCPGRRRSLEEEQQQRLKEGGKGTARTERKKKKKQQQAMYVYVGAAAPAEGGGDKGLLFHHDHHHEMPQITKLIPIDRPEIYEGKHHPTIYKPLHRVYQQPSQSTFVIWAPKKKHNHPWLMGH